MWWIISFIGIIIVPVKKLMLIIEEKYDRRNIDAYVQ